MRVMYVNGAFAGSAVSPRILPDDTGASIGDVLLQMNDFRGINSSRFPGQIDEVSIYSRLLGPTEIASVFNAGSAGKTNAGPYFTSVSLLPDAVSGKSYMQTVTSERGLAPVVYAVSAGALPSGLSLDPSGTLSGVSSNLRIYHFSVRVIDGAGLFSEQVCTLRVVGFGMPPSGMVAWWRAENDAFDSVGTNHGTLSNGVAYAAGNVGQAFSFDGIDDKVPEASRSRSAPLMPRGCSWSNSFHWPFTARSFQARVSWRGGAARIMPQMPQAQITVSRRMEQRSLKVKWDKPFRSMA